MKKIKNIVVPIDFSVTSRNAYQYARNLARVLNATLTVVSINEALIIVSDVMVTQSAFDNVDKTEDIKNFIIEEDEKLNADLLKDEVKAKNLNGNTLDVLVDLSEQADTDLIIMGSSGLEDFLAKIVGTVSHKVSTSAHCPVILIPRNVKWRPINNIVYASNYDSLAEVSLKEIMAFAKDVLAEIHFVNVKNYDPLFETKQKEINWDKLFELEILNQPYHKHTIYGNDTAKELNIYCEEKNINMMTFLSKHRNFWQSLAHKSITENVALTSTIPIMIVHVDDKNIM